jgi:hypothetical protein
MTDTTATLLTPALREMVDALRLEAVLTHDRAALAALCVALEDMRAMCVERTGEAR